MAMMQMICEKERKAIVSIEKHSIVTNKCLKSVTKQNDPNQGKSDQIKVQESKLTRILNKKN